LIALLSHAHRVGTTFALDWSKAREAKVVMIALLKKVNVKTKKKAKGTKGQESLKLNLKLTIIYL
jgi:hypothetical protein